MNELHTSIFCYALTRYLIKLDLTPYDAIVENSKPSNNAEEWVPYLIEVLSGNSDVFKVNDILNSDPVRNQAMFNKQLAQLQKRTVLVSTIAGMLCQRWTCYNSRPYSDNRHLHESAEFVEDALLNFI